MKKLVFKQAKRRPLTFWSDKLSRHHILETKTFTRTVDDLTLNIIEWHYINALDKPTHFTSISVSLDQKIPFSRKLIETQYGYICPICRSNEHLRSRLYLMPMSIREANYFNKSDYGQYCECHGLIS